MIGLTASILLLIVIVKRWKSKSPPVGVSFFRKHFAVLLICFITCSIFWVWGKGLVHQGFDEVFSAVNCASLPPFQTISYYMLPNNHLLFNLLNGLIFFSSPDKVVTGRIISLICYYGIVITVYYFLTQLIKNRLIVILATILVCFQFPIWGFAFEARGYELINLSGWIAFVALVNYLSTKHERWLYVYCTFCIVGYFAVPTFLCFHSALLCLTVIWMLKIKKLEMQLLYSQIFILLFVYLLYLPALSFSGLHSLIGNKYVSANTFTLQEFYTEGIRIFTDYLNYYSANFILADNIGDLVVFLLPLALFFFYKSELNLILVFFYISMWVSSIAIAYVMKIYPIDRSMGAQINISLALSIYVLYLLMLKLDTIWHLKYVPVLGMSLFIVSLGVHFGIKNEERVSTWLYHNDINSKYKTLTERGMAFIPAGATVYFSDECFYWYYLCKKKGCITNNCNFDNEQYYVRLNIDSLPFTNARYTLYRTLGDYEIYQRK
ncbi:MAG: hypothetical protein ACTHJ0_13000 [Flavipsychrobacter sp.]